jgi:purine-binding chemotaxis protein CheW
VSDASAELDFDALRLGLARFERALAGHEDVSPERRREVLGARARAVAASREAEAADEVVALAFHVGGERYALPLSELSMVLEARALHPLAGAPRWLLGAMVARARLVPVLDLRHVLKLEGGGLSDLGRVVVVEADGELFGIAVEEVDGHVRLPRSAVAGGAAGPVRHVTADRLAVLDSQALLEAAAALG